MLEPDTYRNMFCFCETKKGKSNSKGANTLFVSLNSINSRRAKDKICIYSKRANIPWLQNIIFYTIVLLSTCPLFPSSKHLMITAQS